MSAGTAPLGQWLTLTELCDWLNITERHARKMVARNAIPYRKVGRLLRFAPADIERWSEPAPRPLAASIPPVPAVLPAIGARPRRVVLLPKSLIEPEPVKDNDHDAIRSA